MLQIKVSRAIISINGEGVHISILKNNRTVLSNHNTEIPVFKNITKKIQIATTETLPVGEWIVSDLDGNVVTFERA